MPRRSPGEIRTCQSRRVDRASPGSVRRPPTIRGLSASANRQIADFERCHGLPQGYVAFTFMRWSARARRPRKAADEHYGYLDSPVGHIRMLLEQVTHSLRTKARREFSAAIRPIDEMVLARTVNDPFAPGWLRWWARRIEI